MTRVCLVCGAEFTPACNRQRYCGKVCYHKAKYARVAAAIIARRLAARKDRTCAVCGAGFTPKNSRGMYCSHRCANAARSRVRVRVACEVCGAEFTPANGRQRFCSKRCRDRAKFRSVGVRPGRSRALPGGPRFVAAAPSIAKVRAYLAMPPSERWEKRNMLTQEERSLAQRLHAEKHATRCVAVNW